MTRVFLDDIEEIVSDSEISWETLRDSAVLITGATGGIGSALACALRAADEKYDLNMNILALARNMKRAAALQHYGVKLIPQDIREPIIIPDPVDYIFHCAAMTKSPDMALNPVEVAETALKGSMNALKLAREKQIKSMVYLSSMEVYGQTEPSLMFVREGDLGYIDPLKARSCYPESKKMCECLCECYHSEFFVPVKIARLAQTFGAGVQINDSRVYAQFAHSAIRNKDIVLHTDGQSRGNYCYISDAVRGLFLLLLKGEDGEAYNITNAAASMTIREMAELVASMVCGGRVKVIVQEPADIEKHGYSPVVSRRLSSEKIEQLGWKPKFNLTDMYERMILDWRENNYEYSLNIRGRGRAADEQQG
ncbi:MAG: NAD-dependent epimerase/dehydratase family protein [Clostridiales bacterium]|jgi:nucleoside-diphosphate-sugar epimerase|nr:NAD-dependent epimerase/dehydratase family protein [Clostridiales bacterium]